ncbi:MAG: hypothetical protein HKN82_02125 [Akkermansiaceae bacterium]|nr:hypothetical protein [Akkermansiaceae bacterium]NNM29692.1 hypothetical protein [Akkermansiaceae bacterium]
MNPESNPNHPHPGWTGGLADLSGVTLDATHQKVADMARRGNAGTAAFQAWKNHALTDFLALSQVSGRIRTVMASLVGPLRLVFYLRAPVPTLPDPDGDLVVADSALLALNYEEPVLHQRPDGASLMAVIEPAKVWLPNVGSADGIPTSLSFGQPICLGAVAAGIEVKELILQSFTALTMQTIQPDPAHPAGVMNIEAARWFQDPRNARHIPLTREGFLETPAAATR